MLERVGIEFRDRLGSCWRESWAVEEEEEDDEPEDDESEEEEKGELKQELKDLVEDSIVFDDTIALARQQERDYDVWSFLYDAWLAFEPRRDREGRVACFDVFELHLFAKEIFPPLPAAPQDQY